jgi:6-phosphogluconolactonase
MLTIFATFSFATSDTMGGIASSCVSAEKQAPRVHTFTSGNDLGQNLANRLTEISTSAIASRNQFTVAFSGGSLPGIVAPGLLANKDKIVWSKWIIFFVDERHVPLDHADSNFKALNDAFLKHLPVQPKVITINPDVPVDQAATEYEEKLPKGAMDVMLLGMGPDGHTASLFPDHQLLSETRVRVAFIKDSPKPPPERITFTLPYIEAAQHIFFVTTGSSKADVLAKCIKPELKGPNPLPAGRVEGKKNPVEWYVDKDAAAKL